MIGNIIPVSTADNPAPTFDHKNFTLTSLAHDALAKVENSAECEPHPACVVMKPVPCPMNKCKSKASTDVTYTLDTVGVIHSTFYKWELPPTLPDDELSHRTNRSKKAVDEL